MAEPEEIPAPEQNATIRPGDTLILRYAQRISMDQAEKLKAAVSDLIPNIKIVVIGACAQMIVYQPAMTTIIGGEDGTIES